MSSLSAAVSAHQEADEDGGEDGHRHPDHKPPGHVAVHRRRRGRALRRGKVQLQLQPSQCQTTHAEFTEAIQFHVEDVYYALGGAADRSAGRSVGRERVRAAPPLLLHGL